MNPSENDLPSTRRTVGNLTKLRDEIISRWEEKARRVLEVAQVQESFVLRNALSEMIDAVIFAVEHESEDRDLLDKNIERLSVEHGRQRSNLGTYSAKQVLQEYHWLRQELCKCLNERRSMTWAQQLIIQDTFEMAVEAVTEGFADANQDKEQGLQALLKDYTVAERQREITMKEMIQSNIELQAEKSELQRSNRELDQFAYTAAHDLKAPLNSISQFIELITQEYDANLDERTGEYAAKIAKAATRMRSLIEKLLFLGRLGARHEQLNAVNLNRVLEAVLENLAATIQATNGKIRADSLPVVMGDESELQQIFQNLVGNALKFTRNRSPEIAIKAEPAAEETWHIFVQDNGIGIRTEHLSKIFRPFMQLDSKEKYEGSGLGLAICKKIVERHNGKIWVESEWGNGSTFHIILPRQKIRPI